MSQPYKTFTRRRYPMAAGAVINSNDTVGIITGGGTGSGYAQAAAHVTTLRIKGVADAFYDAAGRKLGPATNPVAGDNSGGAAGDMFVEVAWSIEGGKLRSFRRLNDTAGSPLTQADCGSNCFALDGVTVTGASSGNSHAGEVDEINPDGSVQVIFPLSY